MRSLDYFNIFAIGGKSHYITNTTVLGNRRTYQHWHIEENALSCIYKTALTMVIIPYAYRQSQCHLEMLENRASGDVNFKMKIHTLLPGIHQAVLLMA